MPNPSKTITTIAQLRENLETVACYLDGRDSIEQKYARSLLRRGICFVCAQVEGQRFFAPSRFIGYVSNSRRAHNVRSDAHGAHTNRAISEILGCPPEPNSILEERYERFCDLHSVHPANSFGMAPKFWILDEEPTWESHLEQFEQAVRKSSKDRPAIRRERLKQASRTPEKEKVTTTVYRRNPDVVAEVLDRARGVCELCRRPAPFTRTRDGQPYLEVHHKIRLADGGDDTVENALGLCANCHRKLHYG